MGIMDIQQRHAVRTYSHGFAARTCSVDKQQDKQHGHAAWRHENGE
jgi:hypothetical protein